MGDDPRTISVHLSTVLATVRSRYPLAGASFRASWQSQAHSVSEMDIATGASLQLPANTKFVMVGTEDPDVTVTITTADGSVTLPIDQVILLPGGWSSTPASNLTLNNTSTKKTATVRVISM